MPTEVQKGVALIQTVIARVTEFLVTYSFDILGAILVLIAGSVASRWAGQVCLDFLAKRKFDQTLSKFAAGAVRGVIFGFALIVALGKFGITISPIVAAVSAMLFGGTFALQGPLSNFAAGVTLLISRPFVVGDTITVKGVSGIVDEVKLGATVLSTEDGERITIPNKHIVGEILYNSFNYRVIETTVGISYTDDPERAIAAILQVFERSPDVATKPGPLVGIQSFGDSAITLGVRYWVPTRKYFYVWYATHLEIWRALKAAGITIPFPQREIRIVSSTEDGPSA